MNTLAKQIIGAAIGGAIGLFVAQVAIDYIEYVNDPLEFEDEYEETEEYPEGTEADEENLDKELLKRPTKMSKKNKVKNYTEHFISQNRPDLAALAAKYNGESSELVELGDEQESIEEEVEFEMIEEDDDTVDPKIISMEEYAEDNELTHLTLHYYSDDVLADEKNKPINRPERILGEEALVSFGTLSNDEDVVYVRNLEKKAMYEIVRMEKPFINTTEARVQRHIQSKRAAKEEDDGEDNNS